MDPIQIIEIRDLIKQLGQDHTVILSSHILSEVQAICEKILIIAHGKLVAFDQPDKLESQLLSANEISFKTDAPESDVREALSTVEHITELTVETTENILSAHIKTDAKDIHAVSKEIFFAFAKRNQALLELTLKRASLEDIFLELTETEDPAKATEGGEQS